MWQQHRLLCHELHDSSVASLPTVYYRAIESLDLHKSCPKIDSEYLLVFIVYILPRMEEQTSPKAGTAKQNANSKPYAVFGTYIKYPRSNSPIYLDFLFPIFVNKH